MYARPFVPSKDLLPGLTHVCKASDTTIWSVTVVASFTVVKSRQLYCVRVYNCGIVHLL